MSTRDDHRPEQRAPAASRRATGAPAHDDTALERALAEAAEAIEVALHFPRRHHTRWHSTGLSRRGERWFNRIATLVLLLFVGSWGWAIADARADAGPEGARRRAGLSEPTARIAAAISAPTEASAAYLTEAALAAFAPDRGLSGKLRATIHDPGAPLPLDSLPEGADVGFATDHGPALLDGADSAGAAGAPRVPSRPGIWRLVLSAGNALKPIADFAVITRRPLSDRKNGRVGLYYIGRWPTESAPRAGYRTPSGFIEVTPENQDTYVSEHFQLRDFLTKGQADVWPKYLVLDMQLVDKLELVLADLAERGVDVRGVVVMSGFRTPQYNETGGNTAGRASLSRHMYGDASDVFIDNDGDGWMDDINRDGRKDVGDARYLAAAAERVERKYPSLVGGIGIYRPGPGHGPFVHIDTRGYRARW